ncbi:hypothetical protein [Spirillospora sp. NPDC048823]|uniref:hypothetical protein n=1 Tax=unclassified Spirillospora TaxID=2642701 RepID=UPI003713C479
MTTAAAAAAVAALATVPASAVAYPVVPSVSPGGNVIATNVGPIAGLDNQTGAVLVCSSVTAEGSVKGGTNVPGDNIATVTSISFSGCVANGSIPTTVTPQGLPWFLDVTDLGTATTTIGELTGVKFQLDAPSVPCTAVITGPGGTGGKIAGVHTNPTTAGGSSMLELPVGGANDLSVQTATPAPPAGCPTSLINPGDTVTLNGKLALNPGQTM